MSALPAEWWPWLGVAGLGFYHGINPAMGWLFAVALGLHRRNRKILVLSWVPIALGHGAAVAIVLAAMLILGFVMPHAMLGRAAALLLIGWAIWHALRGHRRRVRVGLQAGLWGLALWSFLMAAAHGAGLMLVPVLLPYCFAGAPGGVLTAAEPVRIALAGFGIHTAAMLATIALVSTIVYEWVGLGFLRAGWVNADLVWTMALGASGALLMLA